MRFRHVRLHAPHGSRSILEDFYIDQLGLTRIDGQSGVMIGETGLVFESGPGEPFYHFALLVPGNRFDEALEWIAERTDAPTRPGERPGRLRLRQLGRARLLLPRPGRQHRRAHRPSWSRRDRHGQVPSTAAEIVGFSELGLVGDKPEMAAALQSELGLEQWDGDLADEARLAFVGEKARTFIVSPEGRGWLPTGRPAEAHPCDVELSETRSGEAHPGDSRYRIAARARWHLERLALVHRPVTLGHVVERLVRWPKTATPTKRRLRGRP